MNYKVGDTITYYEKFNATEKQYVIHEMYRSFIVCRSANSGNIKHIYREFYKNIKNYEAGDNI